MSSHEKGQLIAARRRLQIMETNAATHGSIHPKVTGKKIVESLNRTVDTGKHEGTITLNGKTLPLTKQKQPKPINTTIDVIY